MKKLSILYLLIIFLIWGLSLFYSVGPWEGKIIDEATKQPLEGTVVLAVWQRVYRTPAGSNSYFYEAKEVMTDKEGKFRISNYSPINFLPIISYMRGPLFTIFKAGYGNLNTLDIANYLTRKSPVGQNYTLEGKWYSYAPGVIGLPKLKAKEERLKTLSFPYGDVPDHKMPKMIEAINKESSDLGFPPSHVSTNSY